MPTPVLSHGCSKLGADKIRNGLLITEWVGHKQNSSVFHTRFVQSIPLHSTQKWRPHLTFFSRRKGIMIAAAGKHNGSFSHSTKITFLLAEKTNRLYQGLQWSPTMPVSKLFNKSSSEDKQKPLRKQGDSFETPSLHCKHSVAQKNPTGPPC